jgi:hypothetical protein
MVDNSNQAGSPEVDTATRMLELSRAHVRAIQDAAKNCYIDRRSNGFSRNTAIAPFYHYDKSIHSEELIFFIDTRPSTMNT